MNNYQGNKLLTKEQCEVYDIQPYIPSPKLIKAVQLAQILGRPLLIKGEPGCGKSRLAEAVAAELHGPKFREFYFEWNIKSTSKAQDGLYFIDHLSRLSEANIKREKEKDLDIKLYQNEQGRYVTYGNFIELRELGRAFEASNASGLQIGPVILIDEIDKADLDFPNDLLLELDRLEFKIPEFKDKEDSAVVIRANQTLKPIIIITSNDEKQLPPAFLRRCLFHYIGFNEIKLDEIIAARFPKFSADFPAVKLNAIEAFKAWRAKIDLSGSGMKNISTSELLDWVSLLEHEGYTLPIDSEKLPPFYEALLKDVDSIQIFAENEIR